MCACDCYAHSNTFFLVKVYNPEENKDDYMLQFSCGQLDVA
jgi:hypothetical protein